jgi:hypothetical protein
VRTDLVLEPLIYLSIVSLKALLADEGTLQSYLQPEQVLA